MAKRRKGEEQLGEWVMRCNQILPPSQPTSDDDDGAGAGGS